MVGGAGAGGRWVHPPRQQRRIDSTAHRLGRDGVSLARACISLWATALRLAASVAASSASSIALAECCRMRRLNRSAEAMQVLFSPTQSCALMSWSAA